MMSSRHSSAGVYRSTRSFCQIRCRTTQRRLGLAGAASRRWKNENLKRLFQEVHRRGMHILLDLIPGHTSRDMLLYSFISSVHLSAS